MIRIIYLLVILPFLLTSCNNNKDENKAIQAQYVDRIYLTKMEAENLIKLPLKCLQNEYPNKPNQVLSNAKELGTPKVLHPAFYGCFDWHSSVHGHWMTARLLRLYPELKDADQIKYILEDNLSKDNILTELAYFMRPGEKSFERTYGWAWLLKLDEELILWKDPVAAKLHDNLKPLTEIIIERLLEFLPKLNHPIRTGEHPNTAFALSLAYDYATTAKNEPLLESIKEAALRFYKDDVDCPLAWEPGGFDFLSPCLQEADLMSKVLSHGDYKIWFDRFLPSLTKSDFHLKPAEVSDRTDGKLVHLDGLNFCRAWSLYAVAKAIPQYNYLISTANEHLHASFGKIADGSYEGEHWLASFAILALGEPKN